jgi:hypothetical protein
MNSMNQSKHQGPNLGFLALIFAFLFITGLSFVVSFSGTQPYFPGPWESAQTIAAYFRNHPHDVLMCAFFQFLSAVPLGILTVTVVSRLQFFGTKAVGPYIALFGGLMTSINLVLSALVLWVMAYSDIAQDSSVIRTLYYITFAVGGVGYSVPLGLLIAGVAVTGGLIKRLPKWLVWFGLLLAFFGELSCLSLIFPKLVYLIPLTRFPGFIWLLLMGFILPKTKAKELAKLV